MSDENAIIIEDTTAEDVPAAPPPQRRGPLARLGCGLGLVIWAVLLLTPCFFITLAVRGEITLDTGPAPEQRLRVWLIMEPDERGFGMSTAGIQARDDLTCVQTDVRFLLWEGEANPVSYCQCYDHPEGSEVWSLVEVSSDVCAGAVDGR